MNPIFPTVPLILASASPRRRDLLAEYGYRFSVQPAEVEEVAPRHLTVAETTLFNAKAKACAVAGMLQTAQETPILGEKTRPVRDTTVPEKHTLAARDTLTPDAVILAVDTLVALEGVCLGKPRDLDEAFSMLSRLNGRTHEVFSGMWLLRPARRIDREIAHTRRIDPIAPIDQIDPIVPIDPIDGIDPIAPIDCAWVARAWVEVSHVTFRRFTPAQRRAYLARIHPLDKAGAYAAQDASPETIIAAIQGSRTNVIGLPMEALERLLLGHNGHYG